MYGGFQAGRPCTCGRPPPAPATHCEIVVPVVVDGRVVAVLDVDSYDLAAFDAVDAAGLEAVARQLGTLSW